MKQLLSKVSATIVDFVTYNSTLFCKLCVHLVACVFDKKQVHSTYCTYQIQYHDLCRQTGSQPRWYWNTNDSFLFFSLKKSNTNPIGKWSSVNELAYVKEYEILTSVSIFVSSKNVNLCTSKLHMKKVYNLHNILCVTHSFCIKHDNIFLKKNVHTRKEKKRIYI